MNSKKLIALALHIVSSQAFSYYVAFNVAAKNTAVGQFTSYIKANPITVVRLSSQRCGCSANRPTQVQQPRPSLVQSVPLTSAQKFTSLAQQFPTIYWLDISAAQYPDIREAAKVAVGQDVLLFYKNGVEVGRLYGS